MSVGIWDRVCKVRLRWSGFGDEGSRMLGGLKVVVQRRVMAELESDFLERVV